MIDKDKIIKEAIGEDFEEIRYHDDNYITVRECKKIMELLEQELVKKFDLCGVSQQRELLKWLSNEDYFNIPKDEISEILEDWQTYNSNCR